MRETQTFISPPFVGTLVGHGCHGASYDRTDPKDTGRIDDWIEQNFAETARENGTFWYLFSGSTKTPHHKVSREMEGIDPQMNAGSEVSFKYRMVVEVVRLQRTEGLQPLLTLLKQEGYESVDPREDTSE